MVPVTVTVAAWTVDGVDAPVVVEAPDDEPAVSPVLDDEEPAPEAVKVPGAPDEGLPAPPVVGASAPEHAATSDDPTTSATTLHLELSFFMARAPWDCFPGRPLSNRRAMS
jgi:hypothetical protein